MWNQTPMRRRDRAMPEADAKTLLAGAEYGVLATANAQGEPLATPLSFVVVDDALYFHCALKGQKLDNIAAQPRVCFTVVGKTEPKLEENGDFTTLYESAVAHGTAAVVTDADEKRRALMALCEKYLPEAMAHAPGAIDKSFAATGVVRLTIGAVSGKSNITSP